MSASALDRALPTGEPRSATPMKVALLATFTADLALPHLEAPLEAAGVAAELWVGPYGQTAQECVDPESDTAKYRPHVWLIWPRWEELWGGLPWPLADEPDAYVERGCEFARLALAAAQRQNATLVFVLPATPELQPLGVGDANNPRGVAATAAAAREAVRRLLAGRPGALLLDLDESVRHVGAARAYQPRLMALAHMPFSAELLEHFGGRLARLLALVRRPARKVVVIDGDNTLWGGVLGEDGPERVDLAGNGPGAGFLSFQSYLRELRRAGTMLALASKNDPADVEAVFARREMVLRRNDLAASRVGWQAKSISLREIASELDVATDSFVFIDDSSAELAEIGARLPEVASIAMPSDPTEWHAAIESAGVLDRLPPTAEDLSRAAYYDQARERERSRDAASPSEYLAQLGVTVQIFSPGSGDQQRLAQLVAKTNQLNLNGRRRSEAELRALCADAGHLVRLVSARDRFGSYGTVGAFIVSLAEPAQLDTFVLSCRAMGRGIERAAIAYLQQELARPVLATVEELPRNEPARRFFAELGCTDTGIAAFLRAEPWPAHVARID